MTAARNQPFPGCSTSGEQHQETPLRHKEAAAQRLRQAHARRHFMARTIEILARGKWLPRRRRYETARPTEIPIDTIDDAIFHVADAAKCWEVNPSIYNDRRLTQLANK